MAKRKPLGVTVKETIDYVYELLIQSPEGVVFSAWSLGATPAQVISILVERGIVKKDSIWTKEGMRCRYKWVAIMAPTNVLYGSITQELQDRFRERKRMTNLKAKGKQAEPDTAPEDDAPSRRVSDDVDILHEGPLTPVEPVRNPLEIYGIDELWEEIKRRGGCIEENKLTLIKKVVFD